MRGKSKHGSRLGQGFLKPEPHVGSHDGRAWQRKAEKIRLVWLFKTTKETLGAAQSRADKGETNTGVVSLGSRC